MKLIIDTDPGIDDALAIALAHALPDVDLLGLTTVFGNTFVHQSSRNARYILSRLGLDLPVAEGASLPWGATTYEPSAYVHGPEGLGDLVDVPQIGENATEDAAAFLVRMAQEHAGELVVCAIGPLTNIADALKLDPQFARNLKRLVIMGGAYEHPGNVTPDSEANIYHDIPAADAVFAGGFQLEMIGLNTTMKTLLSNADFEAMGALSPVGAFIDEISQFYLGFYRSIGVMNGCPMHDGTAILACTNPERFTYLPTGLAVNAAGTTIADNTRPVSQVAMDVDADWVTQSVMGAMADLNR